MKKTTLIALGAAVALATIMTVIVFVRSGGGKNLTVTSEDRVLELVIPEKALPAGLSPDQIKVEPATEAQIREEMSLAENVEVDSKMTAYRLLPDGAEFTRPVTVRLNFTENPHRIIPALYHLSDGELELVADTEVTINAETGETSVAGPIGHFSIVGSDIDSDFGGGKGMFNYELTAGGEGFVGDSFPYHLAITPGQEFKWFKEGGGAGELWGYDFRMAPMTTWKVRPFSVMTRHDGVIEPMTITTGGGDLKGSESFVLDGTHTCIEDGTNSLFLPPPDPTVTIEYRMEKNYGKQGYATARAYKNATAKIYLEGGHFTCKERGGMVRVQVPSTVICEGSGRSYTGYYAQDPVTGEQIGNVLLDVETGEPIEVICP